MIHCAVVGVVTFAVINSFCGDERNLHGSRRAGFLETVEKLGNLPPSERKIVTKETHQGCLSFAITGFSELSKF